MLRMDHQDYEYSTRKFGPLDILKFNLKKKSLTRKIWDLWMTKNCNRTWPFAG